MPDLWIQLSRNKRWWIIIAGGLNGLLLFLGILAMYNSVRLQLPISLLLPLLGIVLPLLNFLIFGHALLHAVPTAVTKMVTTLPLVLLLFVETIVLTLSSMLFATPLSSCRFERRWNELFRAKEGETIRGIQDNLSCCGYRTVTHMAYPFPPRNVTSCSDATGRTKACSVPWMQAGASTGEMLFAIFALLAVFKVVALIAIQRHTEELARAAKSASRARISEAGRVEEEEADDESLDEEEHIPREPRNGHRASERTPLMVGHSPWAEENERDEEERVRDRNRERVMAR